MKDHIPTISIVMPVWNNDAYIADAIKSLLNQTYNDFELIIVNDSSTDRSKEVALEWAQKDTRIIVIDNTTHPKGLFGALNAGLDVARGLFIARADADDINRSNRLAIQMKFLEEHPEIDIVGGGYQLFGVNTPQKQIFHPRRSVHIAWKFLTNTYFCNPTTLFRRNVLNTIPHYPEVVCEDFGFLSKVTQWHRGHNIHEILIDYRQHGKNYSHVQKEAIKQSVLETYRMNFQFYRGSLKHAELFYAFHADHELRISDVPKIVKSSIPIAQKILKQYKLSPFGPSALYLYGVVKIHICLSLAAHYVRAFYRPLKRLLGKR